MCIEPNCVREMVLRFTSVVTGVFKVRRTKHLPRVHPFLGPLSRCFACKFSSVLVKNVLAAYVIFSDAHHKYVLCLQKAPQQQLYCVSTLLSGAPNSNCNMQVLCF